MLPASETDKAPMLLQLCPNIQIYFYWMIPPEMPSNYLNQCWVIVNWTIRNKLGWNFIKQGKSEGFDSCDRPSNLTKMGFKSSTLALVTVKFDGWPRKNIWHLFYITSSFVLHLKPLRELKVVSLCRYAQFGSKSTIFCPVWPSNLTDDLEKQLGPLLCCFKLCVKFHSHQWFKLKLQPGNAQFGSKSAIVCPMWPWNLTDDLEKQNGHLFHATSSFVHHFVAVGEFELELQSGNAQF